MFKKKEILIIANGNSILNYNYGNFIDNFSIVSRINNYETSKFEQFIGSKTDLWFHGANQGVKPKKNPPNNIIILVPSKILQKKEKTIIKRIKSRQNLDPNQYNLINFKLIQQYERNLSLERLTTGTKTILWAIDNYNKVIIHGFDFFTLSKNHYFDSKIKKWFLNNIYTLGKKHNVIDEMKYVQNLIKNNQIHLLNDIIMKVK